MVMQENSKDAFRVGITVEYTTNCFPLFPQQASNARQIKKFPAK